ncbi:hypothetical protein [Mycobacterium sp. 3519A]|uniref:hypothetical protein n=1 Tax=Mycobacterium sp. 3519A TaxID=2057184 RepID=UPI000C7A3689|nr:hypothetical protein [Mycobacterium sp. 3519A]
MCYPVQCPVCGKTGWNGCGQHVDSVMSAVPPQQRCTCSRPAGANERARAEQRGDPETPFR